MTYLIGVRVAAIASLCLLPFAVSAQSVGGAVPPYQAPPPAPVPQRSDNVTVPVPQANGFGTQEQLSQSFADAYKRAGKPRLAIYWNRQLSDTLNDWYGDSRVVVTKSGEGNLSGSLKSPSLNGDVNISQSGSSQTTVEAQHRVTDQNTRLQPSESWDWQFQDGFLGPFLSAGATVVDRTAIMRITGLDAKGADGASVETMALQGKADLLIEVLVTPQTQSTVGYELRARVLNVKTGQIVAYVNSRALKEWNQPQEAIATSHGFVLPDQDNNDTFGPQAGDPKYKATPEGFVRNRKPPKLSDISQNLAYNVMNGLMAQWH